MNEMVSITLDELKSISPEKAQEIEASGKVIKSIKIDKLTYQMSKLKKSIDTVMDMRKSGRKLTKEEEAFASKVVDEMIGLRVLNKAGVQLISKSKIDFVRKYEPSGIVQDAVEAGQAKDGTFPRKTEENPVEKVAKPTGDKQPALKESSEESGKLPKQTPDIGKIKVLVPENQKEGVPTATADVEAPAKDEAGQPDKTLPTEAIGHNPELPMPQKQAEDLIANAKWGVEIGAYVSVKEGIERQLGRKAYEEFIDTPEKYKAVTSYLLGLIKPSEPVPVAEGTPNGGQKKK